MTSESSPEAVRGVVFAKDGKWIVPPASRPKNWESYGLLEVSDPAEQAELRTVHIGLLKPAFNPHPCFVHNHKQKDGYSSRDRRGRFS